MGRGLLTTVLINFRFKTTTLCLILANFGVAEAAQDNRFRELKKIVFETPYVELPRYKVNKGLFSRTKAADNDNNLVTDAKRTLSDSSDLLPDTRGQKLLQANGICFTGKWLIDQDNPYTGLFAKGRAVPVIARVSTTFSGTLQNERRALGLAIKLLPEDLGESASLNVFALHSAGGVTQKHMLDLSMDNEPPLGRIPRFRDISTALTLKSSLLKADREAGSIDPSVTYRTVAHLASYSEHDDSIAPRWLRFSPVTKERVDRDDFRDELRVENYSQNKLVYSVEVGNHRTHNKSEAEWQMIGRLVFTKSVTSEVCDKRLHFAHPKN